MDEKIYGIGIVGCGSISDLHADVIHRIKNARLIAASDTDKRKTADFSQKHGCDSYNDYNEMLKRDDIDIISICTPSLYHAELAIEAAHMGKHVIIEKPIDISLDKIDKVISECRKSDVKLCGILQRRFDESIVALKETITSGKLGKLYFGACQVKWFRSQEYYDVSGWRGTWKYDGGGALMNQSIHYIDLLQYLMGPVEEIYGRCATLGHERIETEDLAVATIKFKNGALGLIEGTTLAYPGIGGYLDIYGEKGSVRLRDGKIVFSGFKDGSGVAEEDTDEKCGSGSSKPMDISSDSHLKQYEDMLEAVRNDKEPFVNGEEAQKAVRIILGIYESSRTGLPVYFSEK